MMPGDPVRIMLGPRASEDAIAAVRTRYGLDQPILVQYFYYLKNVLRADFGLSLAFRADVLDVIMARLLPTVCLIFYGLDPGRWHDDSPGSIAAARRPGRMDRSTGPSVLRRKSRVTFVLAGPHADHAVQPAPQTLPGLGFW